MAGHGRVHREQRSHGEATRHAGHARSAAFDEPARFLALQRTIGNQATAQYIASGHLQRVIERGSSTGWGPVFWVTGGKALWDRIDQGFNTDLFKLRDDLKDAKAALPKASPEQRK